MVAVIDSGADVAAPAAFSVVRMLAATDPAVLTDVIVAESAPTAGVEPAWMYEVEVASGPAAALTVTVHVTSELAFVATPEPSVE